MKEESATDEEEREIGSELNGLNREGGGGFYAAATPVI